MKRKLAVATATVISLAFPTAIANAALDPMTGVELGVDQEQFSAIQAQFNPSAARTEGLNALKSLRSEMWDRNPYFSEGKAGGSRLQSVAQARGMDKDSYVNNVWIDNDLTWMAIQRAAEQVHRYDPAHTRPDGQSIWDATRNGRRANGEVLMTGNGVSLNDAILKHWGRGELNALNKNRGVRDNKNGHLHSLINPENSFFGFGRVSGRIDGKGSVDSVIAGLTGPAPARTLANDTNTPDRTYNTWLYTASGDKRPTTGMKEGNPGTFPAVASNPGGSSVSSSIGNVGNIIGVILGAVSILGSIWAMIQQFLPR